MRAGSIAAVLGGLYAIGGIVLEQGVHAVSIARVST
jgi:stage V sporulation protein SpoVS